MTDFLDTPTPRTCPNCRQPYISAWIDVPKMELLSRIQADGWLEEQFKSTETIPMREPHRPCPNVREWTNATEGGN